jgi:hypothetical protein
VQVVRSQTGDVCCQQHLNAYPYFGDTLHSLSLSPHLTHTRTSTYCSPTTLTSCLISLLCCCTVESHLFPPYRRWDFLVFLRAVSQSIVGKPQKPLLSRVGADLSLKQHFWLLACVVVDVDTRRAISICF